MRETQEHSEREQRQVEAAPARNLNGIQLPEPKK